MEIISREQAARHLATSVRILVRYEARGFVHLRREGEIEGYTPADVRRLWTILSLQRDLGINLAGVEAILKLRAHLDEVHRCVARLADDLSEALEQELGPGPDNEGP